MYSYQPVHYYSQILSTPQPPATSTSVKDNGQVLGVSTDNQTAIGGNGQFYNIALLGDSMIQTLGANAPTIDSALKKYYPNAKFNFFNFGQGSTTLKQGLEKIKSVLQQSPDLIVIESFAYNNYGNTQSGYDQQWLELGAITTNIRQLSPHTKILLAATIAPDSIHFGQGISGLQLNSLERLERTKTIKLYLQNIANFANSQKFPLADAYHPSLISDNGNPDYISTTDHLHPSSLGTQFFGQIIAKAIYDQHLL